MDATLREKTVEAVKAIKELHRLGSIDLRTMYKGLVALAHSFALGGEVGWVTKLLLDIPISYFQDEQPQQMIEDKLYADVCIELSRLLILHGMVDNAPLINQPPGEA